MNNCKNARLAISRKIDGDLSKVEAAALERHLSRCAGCRAELQKTARMSELLQKDALPSVFYSIEAIRAGTPRRDGSAVFGPFGLWFIKPAGATLAVLGLAIGLAFYFSPSPRAAVPGLWTNRTTLSKDLPLGKYIDTVSKTPVSITVVEAETPLSSFLSLSAGEESEHLSVF